MDAALATLLFFVLLAAGAALGGVDTRRSGGWTRADLWDAGSATPDRPASRLRAVVGSTWSRLLSWRRVRWPEPPWATDASPVRSDGVAGSPDGAAPALPRARHAPEASGVEATAAGTPDGAAVRTD